MGKVSLRIPLEKFKSMEYRTNTGRGMRMALLHNDEVIAEQSQKGLKQKQDMYIDRIPKDWEVFYQKQTTDGKNATQIMKRL
jgi:hypothetical protein